MNEVIFHRFMILFRYMKGEVIEFRYDSESPWEEIPPFTDEKDIFRLANDNYEYRAKIEDGYNLF